jgi:cytochrome c oxidase assembly protein subunit 15
LTRLTQWLPTSVDSRIRLFAWLSLIFQTVIVGSGGAVRLTGSGLGCDTWPKCTDESWVALPEQGIHGAVEFGNRLMTIVLVLIAIATFVLLWNLRSSRRDLFVLATVLLAGIPAQAVLGGISVLTNLNPYVVGLHFVVSVVLVSTAAALVYRVYSPAGERTRAVPLPLLILTHVGTLALAVTVLIGIVTTGAGPHAGDAEAPRNGLDPEILQHVHAWAAYALLAVSAIALIGALLIRRRFTVFAAGGLLLVEGLQIAVGITQARLGLPEILVGIHMVLASLLAATYIVVLLSMKDPLPVRASR